MFNSYNIVGVGHAANIPSYRSLQDLRYLLSACLTHFQGDGDQGLDSRIKIIAMPRFRVVQACLSAVQPLRVGLFMDKSLDSAAKLQLINLSLFQY